MNFLSVGSTPRLDGWMRLVVAAAGMLLFFVGATVLVIWPNDAALISGLLLASTGVHFMASARRGSWPVDSRGLELNG